MKKKAKAKMMVELVLLGGIFLLRPQHPGERFQLSSLTRLSWAGRCGTSGRNLSAAPFGLRANNGAVHFFNCATIIVFVSLFLSRFVAWPLYTHLSLLLLISSLSALGLLVRLS